MTIEEVIARAIHEGFRTSSSDGWVDTLYDPIMDTVIDGSFDLREVSRAILSAIRAAGLVVVPEEPTEAMIVAGITERHLSGVPDAWSLATVNIYRAMIRAATSPDAPAPADQARRA